MKEHRLSILAALALGGATALHAQTLVNLGLVGVGRVPANAFDLLGPNLDTLGGIGSGMALDLGTLTKAGNTYTVTYYAVPDRGAGSGTTDFHPRLQTFTASVTPYYGPQPAPAQNQILLALTATTPFTIGGAYFTGFDPRDSNVVLYPQSTLDSPGQGRRSLDPEGVARAPDGGFFVCDEYGPRVYRFSALGQYEYELTPPDAYTPKTGPVFGSRYVYYGEVPAQVPTNDSGRYLNRGFEGITMTPDGKKVVTILQLPVQQDGENRNTSRNDRLLVFDVDPASPTYRQPVAEYIYQVTLEGNEAKNRNTGVSEILALNNTQFLVLEREGRGRGGDPLPILYKRVIKADISAATDLLAIAGTPYDLEKGAPGQLSLPRASLPAGIVAAARSELVDIADARQLAKFGLNVSTTWDDNTLSEKWEGLGIVPLGDPAAPSDYLLLVASDNDFLASVVYHNGVPVATNDFSMDSLVLAFRIGADAIPPIVICPGGTVRVPAGRGCTLPLVTGFVQAEDNSAPPVRLSQDPTSGAAVTLETPVAVTVRGTDAAGNVSQPCSFTVVVFDGPPTITCPGAVTLTADTNCKAVLPNLTTNAVASDNCGAVTVTQDLPAGAEIGPGTYTVTLTATDSLGQMATCTTKVTVADKTAPVIIGVAPSLDELWPPNQKMVSVSLTVDVADNCDPMPRCEITGVTSSEPVIGDYDWTTPDWEITGPLTVDLRAERLDTGPGRVYTLTVQCTDAAGNKSTKLAKVTVPHDQGRRAKGEF